MTAEHSFPIFNQQGHPTGQTIRLNHEQMQAVVDASPECENGLYPLGLEHDPQGYVSCSDVNTILEGHCNHEHDNPQPEQPSDPEGDHLAAQLAAASEAHKQASICMTQHRLRRNFNRAIEESGDKLTADQFALVAEVLNEIDAASQIAYNEVWDEAIGVLPLTIESKIGLTLGEVAASAIGIDFNTVVMLGAVGGEGAINAFIKSEVERIHREEKESGATDAQPADEDNNQTQVN